MKAERKKGAPAEAGARKLHSLGRQGEYGVVPHFRRQALFRHRVAQRLPFLSAPVLDQVPRGIEADVVIKNADPESRQRQ